jgi:hypothetical protein
MTVVNHCLAAARGKPANLAASSQGSRFKRASADSTLSSVPLCSSAIEAYKNSSNSEPGAVAWMAVNPSSRGSGAAHRYDNEPDERKGCENSVDIHLCLPICTSHTD